MRFRIPLLVALVMLVLVLALVALAMLVALVALVLLLALLVMLVMLVVVMVAAKVAAVECRARRVTVKAARRQATTQRTAPVKPLKKPLRTSRSWRGCWTIVMRLQTTRRWSLWQCLCLSTRTAGT
jgi:hypothetical protein